MILLLHLVYLYTFQFKYLKILLFRSHIKIPIYEREARGWESQTTQC